MIRSYEASYQQFGVEYSEDTPQGSGVVIHVVPDNGKARWNHIVDLDTFFCRIYIYHQQHGFACMALKEVLELFQFVFVVVFSIFLLNCVDYPVMFKDKVLNDTRSKLSLNDTIIPTDVCLANFGSFDWTIITIATLFWILRFIKVMYNLFQFWDVKLFFNTALKIADSEIDNVTWHEVEKRILVVQVEQKMCIHKTELTELDIYNRILRNQNYLVAMINKGLLPPRIYIPFFGEFVYWSRGFEMCMIILLFGGPWSLFENSWHLKEEYKKISNRNAAAKKFARNVIILALANLSCFPAIFLWMILHSFFSYAELLKRDPSNLGARTWSLYAKYYFRHFNELDHELEARLKRAYRPATKYMNSFTNPLMAIIARNCVFVFGACFAVLITLSVYDEDVLTIEHFLTLLTMFGAIVAAFRVMIPDENLIFCPEHLMGSVLGQVHYIPSHWRGKAHTQEVRNEFAQLFPYKAVNLLMEIVSPIVTPILLITYVLPKVLAYIDFYRNFTVDVGGVGDVCSFAQMDIRAHGNPDWYPGPNKPTTDQSTQAEDGKTELSLIHFTLTNPTWSPPEPSSGFISNVKEEARKKLLTDPLLQSSSVAATGMMGPLDSILQSQTFGKSVHTNVSSCEGPVNHYLYGGGLTAPSLGASVFRNELGPTDSVDTTPMDMTISTLYLHQAHQRGIERRGGVRNTGVASTAAGTVNVAGGERLPLLGSPSRFS